MIVLYLSGSKHECMTTREKLASLREEMKTNDIEAFIVYSADPHMSEYLPDEWQERTWLSGFTGSAGFVVITLDKAGLWTDGRYFTQAPIELKDSGIELFKEGVEGTPHYIDWIISETSNNAKIAVNALATSHNNWEEVATKLSVNHRQLIDKALLEKVWTNRGSVSKNPVFVHPIERAGQTVTDKITAIRNEMKKEKATAHIISSLDDVAWTVNLRGSDVACNPVFLGYIYISLDEAILFVDLDKLEEEAKALMKESGVEIREYSDFFNFLTTLSKETIWIAKNTNHSVFEKVKAKNTLIKKPVPGHLMKAVKNSSELKGFETVMLRDGIAMVNFLYWLTHNVGKKELDEYEIGQKLLEFRQAEENFVGNSFASIVGYKGNGAIIHYSAPSSGSAKVLAEGSILIDSGGQYLEGTTDITRTIPLGKVDHEFKVDSTLALKGLIKLSMVKFPKGTKGVQLDSLARMALWEEGKDYNHGTGHGVGSFMNVHEGPQSIRKDLHPTALEEGMVLSNEPGYYVEGKYGIRHENLIVVKEWKKTEWNTFYEFKTLTLCPFFTNIIEESLLTNEEKKWLNDYHHHCKEKLGPFLEGKVKKWFLNLVAPI